LDVIDLDTPSVEVIKISSSCDLSIFSSRANSQPDEGTGAMPERSLSASIGELWPDIDKLDEINRAGASIRSLPGGVLHDRRSMSSVIGTNNNVKPEARGALQDDVPGPSTAPPRGYGGDSARNKAVQILSTALGAVSPCMRRSFVDSQYSPLTGMDQSE
jgi:hypothetical protein